MLDLSPNPFTQIATSHEGYTFDPKSSEWKISREHTLNLQWVEELLEVKLAASFLKVAKHYAEKYSAVYTCAQCWKFQHFVKHWRESNAGKLSTISAEALIGYRSTLDREHEYYLGALRGFLKTWIEFGYIGIEESLESLLDNWRLKGNIKGKAVQTLCPIKGPLSDFEFEALHQGLIDAFEAETINIEDFALAQVFLATGRRPAQLADLKIKDFIDVQAQDGHREFLLNVPRRKQRGIYWREQFKPFALSKDNGLLLTSLIEKNKYRLYRLLNTPCLSNFEEFPLFPNWDVIEATAKAGGLQNIEDIIKTPEGHHIAPELSSWLDAVVSGIDIPSERTGKRLRVFPTRLRRTLATRAAREGFGELIIAELLDHTDTQNARVYTENVPEHVDAINEAVARQLAPLAQAFAGVVVARESDAKRGDDLTSRVRCESGNVGTCGHHGFCGALAPIACYTCRNFQPWVDGPHEEVLNFLIADRERVLQITKDKAMASVNDRTIFAVTQVIQICERRRSSMIGESCNG